MGLPAREFLKSVSHIGAHAQDYFKGELKVRGWKKVKNFEVVYNGCYMAVLKHYKEMLTAHGSNFEEWERLNPSENWRGDREGDICEIASTIMLFRADATSCFANSLG